jgi:hypothetical protein
MTNISKTKIVCCICLFVLVNALYSEKLNDHQRQQIISKNAESWKKYLGDIDLSENFFFERMIFLKPQPPNRLKNFNDNIKLAPNVAFWNRQWLQTILKKSIAQSIVSENTKKYYLRENTKDESLLEFSSKKTIKITILLSYSAMLINFRPDDFNIASGVNRDTIIELLRRYTNIDLEKTGIVKLLTQEKYKAGIVFSNNTKRKSIYEINNWDEDILCFITENGIFLLLFKVHGERALDGIPREPKWLDIGVGLLENQ